MTKEEFYQICERHDSAFRLQREIDDMNTLLECIQRSGVDIRARAGGYTNLRGIIDPLLVDKIQQMVTDALMAKVDGLNKQFDEL